MTGLKSGEYRLIKARKEFFIYLVATAAVFRINEVSLRVLEYVSGGVTAAEDIVQGLLGPFDRDTIAASIRELITVQAITYECDTPRHTPTILPLQPISLNTLVLNVTNKCNLACTYCYEYGSDKIVDTEHGQQPKFMTGSVARSSVDLLLKESSRRAHLTFFGGETLLNFPVLRETVQYARKRADELGKEIDFSLTTNATLLKPDIVEFLAENDVGVTVSIDGPPDVQDKFRVFPNGDGSYHVIAPKIRELLRRHRTRPIGARVTLTTAGTDVIRIYRHLTEDVGFAEVGFAPVTASPDLPHTLREMELDGMLAQFSDLADEFLNCALANKHHGFSNVKDTLEEIHKGVNKAYPCGAGFGLLGVATDGAIGLCHRFAGSAAHQMGTVDVGIDRDRQYDFLASHHIDGKTDCSRCWARPLCSGGCYHEAYIRHGSTTRPNLHFCEWIRGWTDTCLRVYGTLAEENPAFLCHFDREEYRMETAL